MKSRGQALDQEDFWIKVDDYRQLALSRHAAFMQQVARLETYCLDRVFRRPRFRTLWLTVQQI